MPAQDDGLLAIDPDTDDAAVFVVVVVARCSNPSPDESAVGEERTESCQERRTWWKETGNDLRRDGSQVALMSVFGEGQVKIEDLLFVNQ